MGELFWITQAAFMQHRRGYLSAEAWAEFERSMLGTLQHNLTKQWWRNREVPFSAEFTSYVDRVMTRQTDWRPQITARQA